MKKLISALLLTFWAASQADAAFLVFDDRASFHAAAGVSLTLQDFNDLDDPDGSRTPLGPDPLVLPDFSQPEVIVTAFLDQLFATPPSVSGYDLGDDVVLSVEDPAGGVAIVFSLVVPANAFGIDFGAFGGGEFTFEISDGSQTTLIVTRSASTAPDTSPTFIGFLSDSDILTLTVTAPTTVALFDQLEYGVGEAPALVPEPATLALMSLGGLGLLGGWTRNRRRTRATA